FSLPRPLDRMISLCYRIDVTLTIGVADMTQERVVKPVSGSVGLTATILLALTGILLLVQAAHSPQPLVPILLALLCFGLGAGGAAGLFTAQPNQGVVLILFGTYAGTV